MGKFNSSRKYEVIVLNVWISQSSGVHNMRGEEAVVTENVYIKLSSLQLSQFVIFFGPHLLYHSILQPSIFAVCVNFCAKPTKYYSIK